VEQFFTPEEVAALLKVKPSTILDLIDQGQIGVIRIAGTVRVPEDRLRTFLDGLADQAPRQATPRPDLPPDGSRWEQTFGGRSRFRIRGSVAEGAEVWFGARQYPLHFSKEFFTKLLVHFRGQTVPVGLDFRPLEPNALGGWIQANLPTKMNPTCFVAGLLVAEGYAERGPRRGDIHFFDHQRQPAENHSNPKRDNR
jgi:excisionase family DNA binding protein